MLHLPRKLRYGKFQKLRDGVSWCNSSGCWWGGSIVMIRRCKLYWWHFELIRLRLVRGLGRYRRLSRKLKFRQKTVRRVRYTHFKCPKRSIRVKRFFWYGGFPHLAASAKSRGMRMGKGKGSIRVWYYLVRGGNTLMYVWNVNRASLDYVLRRVVQCLPGCAVIRIRRILYY